QFLRGQHYSRCIDEGGNKHVLLLLGSQSLCQPIYDDLIWCSPPPWEVRVPLQPKDKKAKRSTWKFNLDLTHPVEDGIFDSGNFGTFPREYLGLPSLVLYFFCIFQNRSNS
uniref:Ribosomal protein L22 like 1 n=1 Tax=Sarcophilus harrisii TaxID=9305 RepID=A0A7N4PQ28_SARHA